MKTTLVIPDAHSTPEQGNERFTALGNWIVANTPDHIVQMGDWVTCDSISFHEFGKPLLKEGKRLKDDIDCGVDAYWKMMTPVVNWNRALAKRKTKKYSPKKYWLEANHEYRVFRYLQDKPELKGYIADTDLVGATKGGWQIVPYKQYIYIDGIAFTHVPHYFSGVPVSGKYANFRTVDLSNTSIVYGHTHKLMYNEWARVDDPKASKIQVLNCGWFGDYRPNYTVGGISYDGWWSGIILLKHILPGVFDFQIISMNQLKEEYL